MRDIKDIPRQLFTLCEEIDKLDSVEVLIAHHRSTAEHTVWQITFGMIEDHEAWEKLRTLSYIIEKPFPEYSFALGLRFTSLTLCPHYQTAMVDMQPAMVFNLTCQSMIEEQSLHCAELLAIYLSGEKLPQVFPEFLG